MVSAEEAKELFVDYYYVPGVVRRVGVTEQRDGLIVALTEDCELSDVDDMPDEIVGWPVDYVAVPDETRCFV